MTKRREGLFFFKLKALGTKYALSPQRQRSQYLTSASGDAIWGWGAHRPNYIHGQFGGIFFGPPGIPGPPVHPRGNFHQTDFPPLSCSVLRVPALLRPHPSGAPAGARTLPSPVESSPGLVIWPVSGTKSLPVWLVWDKSFKSLSRLERDIVVPRSPRHRQRIPCGTKE
jgi:hypothetical protein